MENRNRNNDAEDKRTKAFEERCDEMKGTGYTKGEKIFTTMEANTKGLLMPLPFMIIAVAGFYLRWGAAAPEIRDMNLLYLFIGIVISIPVHELIHGLAWSISCPNGMKDVHLGLNTKAMMPYCHCKQPLNKKGYLLGALMPGITLGLGLFIISLIYPYPELMVLTAICVMMAGGDFLISWGTRVVGNDAHILDHPVLPGFVYFH